MKINEMSLVDHHVHAQEICIHNPVVAKMFAIDPGKSRWGCPPVGKYAEHVARNNLDTIWLIFENPQRFSSVRKSVLDENPSCQVKGFFLVRDPFDPNLEKIRKLHNQNFVHGFKLHPINDNYLLLPEVVDPTIKEAHRLGLPVMFHSDDRRQTMHLTSPEIQRELVTTYPNVRFVIGHGGAYANPRLVGKNPQVRAYWETRAPLVKSALELSLEKENVFYETSVLTNRIKAEMVAQFVNANPLAALKILLGTDFPIKSSQVTSQLEALVDAGMEEKYVSVVAGNRL